MIIVSSTGEGLRLALRGRAGDRLLTLCVAELPNGKRTQVEAPLLTVEDAWRLADWLDQAAAARLASGAELQLSTPDLIFALLADDGHDADLRLTLTGACHPAWADDAQPGPHLRLLVAHHDLEVSAGHWRRECTRHAS